MCNLREEFWAADLNKFCSVGFYNKKTASDHDYVPKLMGSGARISLYDNNNEIS
jgi:hypothetical protein